MINHRSKEEGMKVGDQEINIPIEIKIQIESIVTVNTKITDDSSLFNTLYNIID